jgi:anti-sigma-K factor RskA
MSEQNHPDTPKSVIRHRDRLWYRVAFWSSWAGFAYVIVVAGIAAVSFARVLSLGPP